jgi:hypothetical protein
MVPSYVKNSSLAKRGGWGPWWAAAKAPSWRLGAAGMDGGVRDEYASAYPGGPPRAAAPYDGGGPAEGGAAAHGGSVAGAMGGADGWPRSKVGAVAHDGSGDGDGGNFSAVIGTPCFGGAETGGGSDRCRSTAMACFMLETESVRSRRPVESSWMERTGAGSRAGAAGAADADGGAMVMDAPDEAIAAAVVGGPEDIATEESDTKLVEPRGLPGRDRRL